MFSTRLFGFRAWGVSFYDVRKSQLLELPLRLNRLVFYTARYLYWNLLYSQFRGNVNRTNIILATIRFSKLIETLRA
ncbi:MAG: hypothetical protein LM590_09360 [Thermofilum sp.]|nr:hypothetical protein [Thermofilum sp.]